MDGQKCIECSAGTYSAGGAATTCTTCNANQISDAGASECKDNCNPG